MLPNSRVLGVVIEQIVSVETVCFLGMQHPVGTMYPAMTGNQALGKLREVTLPAS